MKNKSKIVKTLFSVIISTVCSFLLPLLCGASFLVFEKEQLYFYLSLALIYLVFLLLYFLPKITLSVTWWTLPAAVIGCSLALAGILAIAAITNNWGYLIVLMIAFCTSVPFLAIVLLADTVLAIIKTIKGRKKASLSL